MRGSQGQKIPEKSRFFAMRPASICSGVLKFHKKYSLPSSQSLIFRGLARGCTPLNAYEYSLIEIYSIKDLSEILNVFSPLTLFCQIGMLLQGLAPAYFFVLLLTSKSVVRIAHATSLPGTALSKCSRTWA